MNSCCKSSESMKKLTMINWLEVWPVVAEGAFMLLLLSTFLHKIIQNSSPMPIWARGADWVLWYWIIRFLTKKMSTLLRNIAMTIATVWVVVVSFLLYFNIDFHVFGIYFQFCTLLIAGILFLVRRRERCTK